MSEFWERNFTEKQKMWGGNPAHSAGLVKEYFVQQNVKNVLIPGCGYGRNAQLFMAAGMKVTGIEISKTAIAMAKDQYGDQITIHHGSVMDMPFDAKKYEGIYCHALVHLLNKTQRKNLIKACYNQLSTNAHMYFTVISKAAPNFGKGKYIDTDCYQFHKGVKLFYYDAMSIEAEFGTVGLIDISAIDENQPFYLINCKKNDQNENKK